MLGCDKTVTVLHCGEDDLYTATTFTGVSWAERTQVNVAGVGIVYDNSVIVRIPEDALPNGGREIEPGDSIILGKLPLGVTIITPEDLRKYKPHSIKTVGDNLRGLQPHVVVIAK